jgi:hypothetical protein
MSEVIEKDAAGPSNRTLLVILPMPVPPTPDLSDLYSCTMFLELLDLSGSPRPALLGHCRRLRALWTAWRPLVLVRL